MRVQPCIRTQASAFGAHARRTDMVLPVTAQMSTSFPRPCSGLVPMGLPEAPIHSSSLPPTQSPPRTDETETFSMPRLRVSEPPHNRASGNRRPPRTTVYLFPAADTSPLRHLATSRSPLPMWLSNMAPVAHGNHGSRPPPLGDRHSQRGHPLPRLAATNAACACSEPEGPQGSGGSWLERRGYTMYPLAGGDDTHRPGCGGGHAPRGGSGQEVGWRSRATSSPTSTSLWTSIAQMLRRRANRCEFVSRMPKT